MWFNNKKRQSFRQPKIYSVTNKEPNILKINTNFLWFMIIVLILVIVAWFIFYSEYFKIKSIILEGEVNESVKNDINAFYGKNIFLFTVSGQDERLKDSQTSIDKLNIVKGIPDTLKVEVFVRKPEIRWKTGDKTYYIDKNGVLFDLELSSEEYNKIPLVSDDRNLQVVPGNKMVTNDFVEYVKTISAKLPELVKKEIEEIKINETTLFLEIKLKDGYRIYFDTLGNTDDQLKILSKIIENHNNEVKEYIDLRVTNRGYYK